MNPFVLADLVVALILIACMAWKKSWPAWLGSLIAVGVIGIVGGYFISKAPLIDPDNTTQGAAVSVLLTYLVLSLVLFASHRRKAAANS